MATKEHAGLFHYSGEESGNLALGQLGFKVLTADPSNTGDGHFVAFKVIGGAATVAVNVTCTTFQGDAFPQTLVLTGEIVWGAFKKITIDTVGTGIKVLCYYGK